MEDGRVQECKMNIPSPEEKELELEEEEEEREATGLILENGM